MKDFKFTMFPHDKEFVIFVDTIYLSPKYADGFADLFYLHSENKKPYFLLLTKTVPIIGVDIV